MSHLLLQDLPFVLLEEARQDMMMVLIYHRNPNPENVTSYLWHILTIV